MNIDSLDKHGQTALMNAAYRGDSNLVGVLVSHGANLDLFCLSGLEGTTRDLSGLRALPRAMWRIGGLGAEPYAGRTEQTEEVRMG